MALNPTQLAKLNAIDKNLGEPRTVTVNNFELEYCPQSPEVFMATIMTIGSALAQSAEVEKYVVAYFPDLKGHFEDLNFFTIMQLIEEINQQTNIA